jgi:hypothetical protein
MRTTDLYRHFSASGELLYVGISHSTLMRLRSHMRSSPWAHEITRIEIEKFLTNEAARAAETLAIQTEHPRCNVKHTPAGKICGNKPIPRSITGLVAAIDKAGNQSKLARLLGVRPQHIQNWMNRDSRVPSARVLEIERVTGIPRHELRPDIYPQSAA